MAIWRVARLLIAGPSRYHPPLPAESTPSKHSTSIGALILILNLLGWASVPLFLRHFADLIDGWTSNGWRYGFSALVWLPVLIVASRRGRTPKGLWRAAIVPSIVNAVGQVCFTWAHYLIDPALVTFSLRTQLIFVAIGAWILFPRERAVIRTPGYLLGAMCLILGSATVLAMDHGKVERHVEPAISTDNQHIEAYSSTSSQEIVSTVTTMRHSKEAHWQGVALAVGSGLLFACYGLAVRKFMEGMNPVLSFAAICQYTAAAMVILMLIFGKRAGLGVIDFAASQLSMLLLSALIGIAIGHVFYYISIARLGVAVTAGVLQLQPFIVALFSLTLFGEHLNGWQWLGGCVAVLGAMTMLGTQWRMSKAAASPSEAQAIEQPVAIAEGESGA